MIKKITMLLAVIFICLSFVPVRKVKWEFKEERKKITQNNYLLELAKCESSLNENAVGDKNYPHKAFGMFQYQQRTFDFLKEKAKMEWLEIKNWKHQMILTAWAMENGYEKWWSCYDKIKSRQLEAEKLLK